LSGIAAVAGRQGAAVPIGGAFVARWIVKGVLF
jgi:hypothetical protein